uniref:FCS-type domain-containing protein n=1 Tax=Junco hyemalis TaxID=40217 RepID=A0A8C5IL08_JUNHY
MTSGSGSAAATVAGAAPHNGENKPPQAIVKPQILTHVIEGFVIQEGAEPFPVGRSSLLVGALHKQYAQELLPDKLPAQDNTTTTDSDMEEPYLQESKEEGNPPKLKCELCGRVDFAYKFKRSKRFCSMACAKRYNVGCTKRVGLFHPDRSKLQKPGGPPHGRRRSCKGTLPPLSKDSKKQVRGHGLSLRDMSQWAPSPWPPRICHSFGDISPLFLSVVGTLLSTPVLGDTAPWLCHCHQLWGHLSTDVTSRDVTAMGHLQGQATTSHLCPPKPWDLGVTCGGCHCHLSGVPTSQLGPAGIPRSHKMSPLPQEVPPPSVALDTSLSLHEKEFGGGK